MIAKTNIDWITCKRCGKVISDLSFKCPHCGKWVQLADIRSAVIGILAFVIVLFGIIRLAIFMNW